MLAAGLAGWIAVLAVEQGDGGLAHHLTAVKAALGTLIVAGLLAGALAAWRRWAWDVPVAVATSVFAVVTAWFMLVPRGGHVGAPEVRFAAISLPLVVVSGAAVVRGSGRPRSRSAALLALAVIVAVLAVPVIVHGPNQMASHHMRLAWLGLDGAELVTLTATGIGLIAGRAFPMRSAAAAGALLFSDAVINIAVSTGALEAEAVAMAFVEVPIAVVSGVVAVRTALDRRQVRAAAMRT